MKAPGLRRAQFYEGRKARKGKKMRNLHVECGIDSGVPALIVSRHSATVQWLRETFEDLQDAPVVTGNVGKCDVQDRLVVGNLPLNLAAHCCQYVAVEFSGNPPRGEEYDRKEMEAAGVHIQPYTVFRGTRKAMIDHLVGNGFSGVLSDEF